MAEEISRRSGFDSVSTWWMMDVNSCVDGGSDIVMAEDRESESDAVTEETEVADEPEFEFESTVSTTVATLEPARDAPLPDDPSSHRFAPRPVMRHLPGLIEDDISDDRKTPDEFAINPSDDALSNPQNGSDSLGLDHLDLEHSGTQMVETKMVVMVEVMVVMVTMAMRILLQMAAHSRGRRLGIQYQVQIKTIGQCRCQHFRTILAHQCLWLTHM